MEEENVKVAVRIRPMQTMEKKNGDIPCVSAMSDGREVQVKVGPLEAQKYRCSICFNPDTSQSGFFAECGITDLLDSAVEGYRACAFAFGQTGAGKTFTMFGASKINHRDKNVGLIARSLDYLFTKLAHSTHQHRIRISCLEIYQEHVFDLIAEERDRVPLAVREHSTDGFFLEGCRLVECRDAEIACAVLDAAMKNRQVGEHDMNARSSRSHVLTEIHIETFPNPQDMMAEHFSGDVVRGKMSLVDLAGSERLKATNSTGKVRQEAGFINRSLYVLGKVIAGLVRTNGDLNHKDVPFRDSKLTKLLISSLGGASRTLMVSCVSEAKGSQAETLRTLKFSMSCARIRNKPVKFLDPQQKLIVDLKDEIKRLRSENQRLRSTMVTAPASGEKFALDDDASHGSQGRAHSAQSSSRSHVSRFVAQDSPKRIAENRKLNKLKNRKTTSRKLLESKSDILAQYPQLKKILERGGVLDEMLGDGRLRPKHRSAPKLPLHKALQDAAVFDMMMQSQASALEDDEFEEASRHSTHTHQTVDDLSRLPGPMIFKDNSPLAPVRHTHAPYEPAQNYLKTMDAKRLEELEQRVRTMEQRASSDSSVGAPVLASLDPSATHAQQQIQQLRQSLIRGGVPVEIEIDAEEFLEKKKGGKKKAKIAAREEPAWKAAKKPSPYIANLQEEMRAKRVVAAHAKPNKPPAALVRKAQKNSHEAAPAKEEPRAAEADTRSDRSKALRDSIADELAELGLGPSVAGAAPAPVPHSKKGKEKSRGHEATTSREQERESEERARRAKEREAGERERKADAQDHRAPKAAAAPAPERKDHKHGDSAARDKDKEKDKAAVKKHTAHPGDNSTVAAAKLKTKATHALPAVATANLVRQERPQRSVDTSASSLDRSLVLRKKLEELEAQLVEKQVEMEDSPGEVTAEMEETLLGMRIEAKTLRLELGRLTGVDMLSPKTLPAQLYAPLHALAADSGAEDEYAVEEAMQAKLEAFKARRAAGDPMLPEEGGEDEEGDPSANLWFFRKRTGSYNHSPSAFVGHDPIADAAEDVHRRFSKPLLTNKQARNAAEAIKEAMLQEPTPAVADAQAQMSLPSPQLLPERETQPTQEKEEENEDDYEDDYEEEFEAESPTRRPRGASVDEEEGQSQTKVQALAQVEETVVAAAKRRADEEAAAVAKRRADEEAAAAVAKRRADEEAAAAVAKRRADEEAAAAVAKRRADEEAAAAVAKRRADEEAAAAVAKRRADEEAVPAAEDDYEEEFEEEEASPKKTPIPAPVQVASASPLPAASSPPPNKISFASDADDEDDDHVPVNATPAPMRAPSAPAPAVSSTSPAKNVRAEEYRDEEFDDYELSFEA